MGRSFVKLRSDLGRDGKLFSTRDHRNCGPQSSVIIRSEGNTSRNFTFNYKTHFKINNHSILVLFALQLLLFHLQNLVTINADGDLDFLSNVKEKLNSDQVSKCQACRLLVDSFDQGIRNTERGKHEGGDTSWEEKNLKSYADSEVRLVEIQEKLCEDVKDGKQQCLSLAEDSESDIEDWWHKERQNNVRLLDFLCISRLKLCCPKNNFGPTCQPCPSDCNKHGNCNGSGTREGTGECECEVGYIGEICDNCDDDHFRVTTSDHFACRPCDSACVGCYGPGPMNCTSCKPGYEKSERNGCIDINECEVGIDNDGNKDICQKNTYCVNTDGSYRCADCHVSCAGCFGYGPAMCILCANGYELDDDNICQSQEELARLRDEQSLLEVRSLLTRYTIYFLTLALSLMMFRTNLYAMYSFLIGFVIFLLISEFGLIEDLTANQRMSAD